jgi:hypothetical protein
MLADCALPSQLAVLQIAIYIVIVDTSHSQEGKELDQRDMQTGLAIASLYPWYIWSQEASFDPNNGLPGC